MKRIRQWLRKILGRDRWDHIPTVTDLKLKAERQREGKRRASSYYTIP